jgi:ABC-type multidrug transport system fused ATPase/permease subunit
VVRESAFLAELYTASGVGSDRGFLLLLGGLVLAFILVGMVVKLAGQYRIIRFGHGRNYSFSRRRLARYLSHPYAWHLGRNSADLGAALLTDCDRVVVSSLLPALRMLAQTVSLLFLLVLLIAVSPGVALASAIGIGGAYGLIFFFARQRLTKLGQRQASTNAMRYQVVQEAFGGIKDVKMRGLEYQYCRRYDKPSQELSDILAISQLIGELPRFLLEAIAFGGLVLIILGLLVSHEAQLSDVLPTLGVFGFAVLKIFPSIQQIYHALTQMRFGAPVLAKLHAELLEGASPSTLIPSSLAQLSLRETLTIEDVHFS